MRLFQTFKVTGQLEAKAPRAQVYFSKDTEALQAQEPGCHGLAVSDENCGTWWGRAFSTQDQAEVCVALRGRVSSSLCGPGWIDPLPARMGADRKHDLTDGRRDPRHLWGRWPFCLQRYKALLDALPVRSDSTAFWKGRTNVCYHEAIFGNSKSKRLDRPETSF
jgi:hypothetical protein